MTATLYLSPELHRAISDIESISAAVRALIRHAGDNPQALPAAFAARSLFKASTSPVKRYAVYLTPEEREVAKELSERYLLSLSQIVQVMVEDMLYRAGTWPGSHIDSSAKQD